MSLKPLSFVDLDETEVAEQLRNGFPWLKFSPAIESAFREWRYREMRKRTRPVGFSVILIFVLYSVMDYLLFPANLSVVTISFRLLLVCPAVAYSIWGSYQNWPERRFVSVYTLTYSLVCGGMAVMIMVSQLKGIMMPYDGLLLMLMGGYFLLGLPFWHIVLSSWALIPVYVICESFTSYPLDQLKFDVFFMATANLIGTVGVYLLEKGQRSLFLNRVLLDIARQKAEQDSESKSRFIASASHDLRQPLHAMHLLIENLETKASEELWPVISQVKESAFHLGYLITSLLDISRLNFGVVTVHGERFDLGELSERIRSDLLPDALSRDIRLVFKSELDEPCWVYSDPVLVERIVRNLLVNALKHSGGDRVVVELQQNAVEQSQVKLRIIDNGKGIPESEQQRLFEEFQQGTVAAGESKGLGLGLAIVKQLSELLELEMTLFTTVDGGCTFSLSFDRTDAPITQPEPRYTPQAHLIKNSSRVLLLEDDEKARFSMVTLLEGWGFDVLAYSNLSQVLDDNADPFQELDLIISDYHLEGREVNVPDTLDAPHTGYTAICCIRELTGQCCPAILMSADADIIEQNFALPELTVIGKPVLPGKLRLIISDAIS
ncbi:signal transduction histidine kinase [Oleiphilus messinensis]|uniref:histidine kinase n=1 Tax=Oleiphilus messinensis TaxID=141451 RepID=A0A1Y0I5U3_9GAMM|nr:hybrid sensor histidine kinase/response regulator [Oleiphilus messinensis]ARU55847.1 signal transduction histidine kinase [Oleiphilus messinensis]